jgi:16S rRNA (uracil1498-N3)-methyltransferase
MDKHEHSLFYIDGVSGESAILPKEEIRHALASLRMGERGTLRATDGRGNIYECAVTPETAVSGEARITTTAQTPRPAPDIHMYIGLPDRDAFERAITDLAAMGAAGIIPVVCGYCQKRWWDDWDKHADRLRRKMIAGIKQSLNPWLPELTRPMPFCQIASALRAFPPQRCFVADAGGIPLRRALDASPVEGRAACIIGPPGGFSPEESNLLKESGCVFVNISPHRLRTELAAIILCGNVVQARVS